MKNYLNFNLDPMRLLPIWLLFIVLFGIPYGLVIFKMQSIEPGDTLISYVYPIMLLLILISMVLIFYMTKIIIENISFKERTLLFNGQFSKFLGMILLGYFLTLITLGIYGAWFMRDMHKFFIDNSSYKENEFKFLGDGSSLFIIMLLTIILPFIALSIIMGLYMLSGEMTTITTYIYQLVTIIIMIPYMYLVYKWVVNIRYKDFRIYWETNFWDSCVKIAMELFLSIITLGIYLPLAYLRLYKYFTERTVAQSSEREIVFGYDLESLNDFLFLWGQILLNIVSLGIYFPWALSKIGKRILGKTFLEDA